MGTVLFIALIAAACTAAGVSAWRTRAAPPLPPTDDPSHPSGMDGGPTAGY